MSVSRVPTPGNIQQVLAQYRRALLIQDTAAQSVILNALSDVVIRLQDAGDLLQAEINALGPDVKPWQIEQLERFRALEAQAFQEMTDFGQSMNSLLPVAQSNAAQAGANAALQSVQAIAGNAGISASFRALSAPALREIAGATAAGPLRDLLDSFGPAASAELRRVLFEGIGQGQNARVVGRALEATAGLTRRRAQVIARTEILRAGKSANLASFAANDNLISGWRWNASKGPRTCSACLIMDGTEFPTSVTFFPGHPQCRCVAVPILRDYPTPKEQTGREYLESLREADQRRLLGNRKYEAWKSGELELDDMVAPRNSDAWGTSYQEASLAQAEANAIVRRAGGSTMPPQPGSVAPDVPTAIPDAPTPARVVDVPEPTPAAPQRLLQSSNVQRGPNSPEWVGQYEYPTADADLSPEMLDARYRIAAGEDPAQFGETLRKESLRRAGNDVDSYDADAKELFDIHQQIYKKVMQEMKQPYGSAKRDKLREEIDAMFARKQVLQAKINPPDRDAVLKTLRDVRPDYGQSVETLTLNPAARKGGNEAVTIIKEQREYFPKKMWDKMSEYSANKPHATYRQDRATYQPDVYIAISNNPDLEITKRSARHELWHMGNQAMPNEIMKEEWKFLISRRGPNEGLSLIGSGAGEKAIRDEFYSAYAGRIYYTNYDWEQIASIVTNRPDDVMPARFDLEIGSTAMDYFFAPNSTEPAIIASRYAFWSDQGHVLFMFRLLVSL